MLLARCALGLTFILLLNASTAIAQESVDELKLRIEQLEARVQLLERSLKTLSAGRDTGKQNSNMPQPPSIAPPGGERPVQPLNDASDPFRVGVTWVGEAKGQGGKTGKWAISVSERDGQRFAGGLVVVAPNGEKYESPFSGTAPTGNDGLVVMETPLVGRQRYFARGRLQNGEIALTFKATSKLGEEAVGAATLRPKN